MCNSNPSEQNITGYFLPVFCFKLMINQETERRLIWNASNTFHMVPFIFYVIWIVGFLSRINSSPFPPDCWANKAGCSFCLRSSHKTCVCVCIYKVRKYCLIDLRATGRFVGFWGLSSVITYKSKITQLIYLQIKHWINWLFLPLKILERRPFTQHMCVTDNMNDCSITFK